MGFLRHSLYVPTMSAYERPLASMGSVEGPASADAWRREAGPGTAGALSIAGFLGPVRSIFRSEQVTYRLLKGLGKTRMGVQVGEGLENEPLGWGPLHETARVLDRTQLVTTTGNGLDTVKRAVMSVWEWSDWMSNNA